MQHRRRPAWPLAVTALLCAALAGPPRPAAADIVSYAVVRDDGSLLVSGRRVHLFGIYIPPTDRVCQTVVRPVRCGPRAALALEFRIQGFVRCEEIYERADGIVARCFVRGEGSVTAPAEDLAAWMLRNGWAVAVPGAPFAYVTLERIARAQGRGIWGLQVDGMR